MHILRALLATSALALSASAATTEMYVYIGTYTGPQSKGVYVARFDAATGKLDEPVVAGETKNPSFVAIHPSGKYLYAVNETGQGQVTAFAIDRATGKLTTLNSASSRGSAPCHLSIDKSGRNVLVANYSSGTVAAIRIGEDGRLGESTAFDQHTGTGPNRGRQEKAHAHSINLSANQKYAIAADLGTDQLYVYKFDPNAGTLTANNPPSAHTEPGAGPRHFAFDPNQKFAYDINEINSTITAWKWDGDRGVLTAVESVSTLPKDFHGENTTAEVVVHPNGKFVYGSNRGHDSIAVFKVDAKTGKLTPAGHVSTQGKTPRNFAIDPSGKYLFAANQDSNSVVVFKVDGNTGMLTPTGQQVKVGSPVCVRFFAR